jgi:acetyl-CoA C-acetyltransferase
MISNDDDNSLIAARRGGDELAAPAAGAFDDEILPFREVSRDEGPRPDSTPEKMASLKPLGEGGRLTAAVSSQISDGAAVLLVASERAVRGHRLRPLARIHAMAVVGSDPVYMLTGPIPATEAVLRRAGLGLGDIDLIEINEAFARSYSPGRRRPAPRCSGQTCSAAPIALGHPLGASGARLMTTLVHHLRRTGGRYGLQTMCEGGGMANATIVQRV